MIEQQIRTWDVLDDAVLSLFGDIPREAFIEDAAKKPLAYADLMLPMAEGQFMLEPKLEARILQALAPAKHEKILHIGTGSGFFAALLGRLAGEVISVEIRPQLADAAAARLRQYAPNVRVQTGDGARGWATEAPYHAIVLTGAVPALAAAWQEQLTDPGRVLAVAGAAPAMTLQLHQFADGAVVRRDLLETDIPSLDNAAAPAAFSF